MNTQNLETLLKRWAELESNQCRLIVDSTGLDQDSYELKIEGYEFPFLIWNAPECSRDYLMQLGTILKLVLQIISLQKLRLQLENSSEVWHATLCQTDMQIAHFGVSSEPALAVLDAYLDCIEFHSGAEAIGGGG